MKRIFAAALATLLLAGCASKADTAKLDAESDATMAVKSRLRDPSSFDLMSLNAFGSSEDKKDYVVCGSYNARNGFGGMTGEKRFVYADQMAYLEEDGSIPAYRCH